VSTTPIAAEAYADETLWPATSESIVDIRVFHDARRAKLMGDIAAGEMLEIEVMRRRLFTAGRQCRDSLLRMPDADAADAAASLGIDAFPVHQVLREAIEIELGTLAALFAARAKGDA
jgi:hypothetical protein